MPAKLSVYNIGTLGVNVDKNPIQLEDGELTSAQNAISNDDGSTGSLQKRPGLTKVNATAAAGSIKGAMGVPISLGTAGNDGGLTPSPAVDPTTRLFLMGRRTGATTAGWNTSTDTWATSVTTGGPDTDDASGTPRVPDYLWADMADSGDTAGRFKAWRSGRPGVMYQNRFYYAGNDYTAGTTNPTIRMFDGTTDYLMGRLPSLAGTACDSVVDMIVGGNEKIYLTTHDTGVYASNTLKARVFELDPQSGALVQVGQAFPIASETVRVPYALTWHAGRLWTRTHGAGITSTGHLCYYIRPNIDSTWTSETIEASATNVNAMASYNGQLYMARPADATNAATIIVRSTQAVYTTSLTVALTDASPSLVSFGFGNHIGAMAVFGGNLYASYYNRRGTQNDTASDRYIRVYKYDGSSWTVVYNPAANDATAVPFANAVVIGGKLYFVSAPALDSSTAVNQLLYTSNGTAWTSVTTTILNDDSTSILGAIAS